MSDDDFTLPDPTPNVPQTNLVYCRGCGGRLHNAAPACPHCGFPQAIRAPQSVGGGQLTEERREKLITAAVLAVLLGPFGVHRFYLGDTALGFLYLSITLVSVCVGGFIPVWLVNLVEAGYFIVQHNNSRPT